MCSLCVPWACACVCVRCSPIHNAFCQRPSVDKQLNVIKVCNSIHSEFRECFFCFFSCFIFTFHFVQFIELVTNNRMLWVSVKLNPSNKARVSVYVCVCADGRQSDCFHLKFDLIMRFQCKCKQIDMYSVDFVDDNRTVVILPLSLFASLCVFLNDPQWPRHFIRTEYVIEIQLKISIYFYSMRMFVLYSETKLNDSFVAIDQIHRIWPPFPTVSFVHPSMLIILSERKWVPSTNWEFAWTNNK